MKWRLGWAVAVSIALAGLAQAADPPERLNVLFVIADDLNCHLGCYGRPEVKSPNIDRLAARGVRFDRAYCQYALCNPSRASFLSGLRPATTGVMDQNTTVRAKLPDVVFLPQRFRESGWFTGGIGKVFHSTKLGDPRSWDIYEETASQDEQELEAIKRRYANPVDRRTPDWMELNGSGEKMMDVRAAQRVAKLMEEKATAGKPFFLAAGFRKPHLPWAAPRSYFNLYPAGTIQAPREAALRVVPPIALMTELTPSPPPASREEAIRAYFACISFVDDQVGLLMRQLDQLKLWDRTVVVLIGDNGFHLGDHAGLWSKMTNFEQAARIPLIIVAPGRAQNQSCARLAELVDLYPTLAELCGVSIPAGLQGRSLIPLLKQPDAAWDHPAFTSVVHRGVLGRSVRTERWRYTEWDNDRHDAELYDHASDPDECNNLVVEPAQAATVQKLRQLLIP